jgi:hypothetical protein
MMTTSTVWIKALAGDCRWGPRAGSAEEESCGNEALAVARSCAAWRSAVSMKERSRRFTSSSSVLDGEGTDALAVRDPVEPDRAIRSAAFGP